ncbi:phage tail protein [Hafnia paralvei]|uniref:Phage tail protein n=1 Tax=Hafnia paralvei TaxID=546367 RepID=A0A2A2M6X6_9GAMM|nr:phage head-binding domain-containing protein [Hafnia paralvei]PAV94130.1 phage tail protein [Hafnia paralvei]
MSEILANVVVSMPSQLFTLARSFKANANGKIYIGQIDTDPVNPANQIQVYIENEDGSHVPIAQPIVINSGGFPVYNGQIAKFVTVQGHSMAVYDSYGAQQFYFPNVLKYDPDQLEYRLSQPTGASIVGVMPHGTLQDAMKWVTPEMFSGANDSEKLQAAVNYAAANKLKLVASGTYDITTPITVPDDLVIDASNGEFTFNAVDYIFHPLGADSFELHGGKYSASSYHTDRPQIVFNDYPDGRENFPSRVVIKDTQSFNCGIAYLLVNCEKNSNYLNIDGNWVVSDDLTDTYVSGIGIPDNRAKAYLSIIGESSTSVNIGVKRAPMWNITNNSFDVFMQSGYNMDIVKIGGSTIGGSSCGNMFKNRNTESFSEVDTFTGGMEVTFSNNRFKNISFKLETLRISGGNRIGEGGRSVISNNVMHFSKNPLMDYGMWLLSPQLSVSGNVIYYEGADTPSSQRPFTGIYFREGDDINTPNYGGLPPRLCTVSNNTINIITGAISKDIRVQSINTSEIEACTLTGNTLLGGNPQIFSNRKANMRNVWTGNYIASSQFDGNDIYRMQSQMVGAGNYVGSGTNFNNTPSAKVTQAIPAQANGSTLYVNLLQTFDIPSNNTKSLYVLTVVTSSADLTNRQVFMISSGLHDAQVSLPCLDSRFDRDSNDPAKGQYVFKLQWTSANTMQLVANKPYLSTSTPPTKVEYMITAITANLL